MEKYIKELLPSWVFATQDRNLTLTNDLDSLIACCLLAYLFGYVVNHFYSFKKFATNDRADTRKSIGVDLAINKGYTYCNHLTMFQSGGFKNEESCNLNNVLGITREQYNRKYSLSTVLMLYSLYDVPLPLSEDGLKILLCIDSAYLGYYNDNGRYRHIFNDWIERLGMTDLIKVLERNTLADMNDFNLRHELKSFINLNGKNKLTTGVVKGSPYPFTGLNLEWIGEQLGFKVSLPEGEFTTTRLLEIDEYDLNIHGGKFIEDKIQKGFSSVFTYKNKLIVSSHSNNR